MLGESFSIQVAEQLRRALRSGRPKGMSTANPDLTRGARTVGRSYGARAGAGYPWTAGAQTEAPFAGEPKPKLQRITRLVQRPVSEST